MTYMLLLNCALKLVEEIVLYYDARSKKHQNVTDCTAKLYECTLLRVQLVGENASLKGDINTHLKEICCEAMS